MRILQIINNLGSGGAEKLIVDYAPKMKERGHDVEVLLIRKEGSIYIDNLRDKGVKVSYLSKKSLYSVLHILRIRKIIRGGKYDIIHVHIFPSLYYVGLAKLFGVGKVKILYTEHNTFNKRRSYPIFKFIEKIIYHRYNKIISITQEVKDELKKFIEFEDACIKVINNGIDTEVFKQAEPIDLSTIYKTYSYTHKILCMVGRFSSAKNQSLIIEALKSLPDYVHLFLIGEGPLLGEKRALVEKQNLQDRVHFLGLRTDVPQLLKSIDIVVHSSHWEGFGLAVVEAMAAGKPVVASDVKGLDSIVKGAGVLFKHNDEKELVNIISSLLTDVNLYKKVVTDGEIKSKQFDIKFMVDAYLNEYMKVLNNK